MQKERDPYRLDRFVAAQEPVYEQVLSELRAGRKRSHWIWFIFPQIAGLGRSSTAQQYAIQSLGEAEAYLRHGILGLRLRECTQLILNTQGRSMEEVLGSPDDLKFRSSMTLFAQATGDNQIFLAALGKYFEGEADPLTIRQLGVCGS